MSSDIRVDTDLAPGLRIQLISFMLIRIVLNTMHRMIYPFLAVFGRGLGVDLSLLSAAVTTRALMGVGGPFLASVADSRGRKVGILFGVAIFVLGTGVVVIWPTYAGFFLAVILALLGKYVFEPSVHAYISDQVPYTRRGQVMAVTELGWSLSFIVGIPLMGFLIARRGWMAPFPLLTLLGLLVIGWLYWSLPKDPKPEGKQAGMWRKFRIVLTSAPALAGLGVGLLISSANEVVNLVFGVWMEDAFALQVAALGVASAVIGFSELGGESISALLVDRLGKPQAVSAGIILNSLVAIALPFLGRTLPGAVVGLFLFYLTFEFAVVSTLPMMTEILPSARATLLAINIASLSLGRALGALLAPLLYTRGIQGSAFAVLVLNLSALIALVALRRLQGALWEKG